MTRLGVGRAPATAVDRWLAEPSTFRMVVALSVVVRVLFVLWPFDVLDPIDPWVLGRSIWRGEVPYRDYPLEYPPAALLAFVLPGAVPRSVAPQVLAVQAFVLEATLLWLFRDRPEVVRRYLLVSLATVPLLSGGFDAVAVVAVAWSTTLLASRDARGWAAAAFGAAVKLFPGVAWGWCRRRPVAGAVALAVTVGALLAPLAVADSDRTPIGYHADRGVQNESVAASVAFMVNRATGEENRYEYRFRSNELVGAEGAAAVTLVLFGAAAAAVAVACLARQRDDHAQLRALALLLLVLCASKVLSPQFVVLLSPLAAAVGGRLFLAYLPVAFLTLVAFLVDDRRSDAFVAVATVRNVLLVGMAVAAVGTVLKGVFGPWSHPEQAG